MSVAMCERILDRAMSEARVVGVQLYHYNEPLLIRHMPQMIQLCHERNLPVFISSNLVLAPHLDAVLNEAPEIFLISVSGWTQPIYERSHKDGDIERVKLNMLRVKDIRKPGTTVQVSWHRYRYNEHEREPMEEYSKSLGFNFVPYCTTMMPHELAMEEWKTGIKNKAGEDLILQASDVKQACYDRRKWSCLAQDQIITVDGQGNYTNCCHRSDAANTRGSFFDNSVESILSKRKKDKDCIRCRAVGGHVYASQVYTRSHYDPVRLAEVAYRKLGLQGRMPRLTAWATANLYKLSRPNE